MRDGSTPEQTRPDSWRLRSSLQSLFLALTLVGVYFGLWDATRRWGVRDLQAYFAQEGIDVAREDIAVKAPLIIEAGWWGATIGPDPLNISPSSVTRRHDHYFWLFGYVAEIDVDGDEPSP